MLEVLEGLRQREKKVIHSYLRMEERRKGVKRLKCFCFCFFFFLVGIRFLVCSSTTRGRMRSADVTLLLVSAVTLPSGWGGQLLPLPLPGAIITHSLKSSARMANDSLHTYHNICMH